MVVTQNALLPNKPSNVRLAKAGHVCAFGATRFRLLRQQVVLLAINLFNGAATPVDWSRSGGQSDPPRIQEFPSFRLGAHSHELAE
jgi:hypothetical protein